LACLHAPSSTDTLIATASCLIFKLSVFTTHSLVVADNISDTTSALQYRYLDNNKVFGKNNSHAVVWHWFTRPDRAWLSEPLPHHWLCH
jgi:hypothetical protein